MANAHTAGQLPPGLKLKLTPDILVRHCLLPKLKGKPLPSWLDVKECDLYGSKKPGQIWEELGGHASSKGDGVFFFTTLTKTSSNFKRKNGFGGTWTGKGSEKVFSENANEVKKPIARRRRLVYTPPKTEEEEPHKKKSELEHCRWTAIEYTLDVEDSELAEDLFECSSYSTLVLCQLLKREQNHHETTPAGKRKRHDSVNQDSQTDAGDPSDSIFNRQSSKIENREVQNFNTGGGVPLGLNYTQPSDPSLVHDKVWDYILALPRNELTAMSDELKINQDSHTDAGDPSDPDYNLLQNSNTGHVVPRSPLNPTELLLTLEIDTEWTRERILRLLDLTPDQSQVQDSQSHNLDQIQVQDFITDDVVPPSQLWGTYPLYFDSMEEC